jgi:hypothetical protein
VITDAVEWRRDFPDGYSTTVLTLDPGGRIRVYGYDGEDLMHCTSHSAETAEQMADLLQRMASHSKGGL